MFLSTQEQCPGKGSRPHLFPSERHLRFSNSVCSATWDGCFHVWLLIFITSCTEYCGVGNAFLREKWLSRAAPLLMPRFLDNKLGVLSQRMPRSSTRPQVVPLFLIPTLWLECARCTVRWTGARSLWVWGARLACPPKGTFHLHSNYYASIVWSYNKENPSNSS